MSIRYAVKAALVGFLMLVLLVPLAMINGTIGERARYRDEAVAKVAESYAGPQSIAGPVLVVPYVDTHREESLDGAGHAIVAERRSQGHWLYFPRAMALDGKVLPAERRLGLHRVRVYELQSRLQASFDASLPPAPVGFSRAVGTPYLSYSIADVRGLVRHADARGRRQAARTGPGRGRAPAADAGCMLSWPAPTTGARLRFDTLFASNLGGTESLQVVPIGDSNRIALASSWPHPQFSGRFLPRERDIGAQGFRATWDISSLASAAQAQYSQGRRHADGGAAGGPGRSGERVHAGRPRQQVRHPVRAAHLRGLLHVRTAQAVADPPDPIRAWWASRWRSSSCCCSACRSTWSSGSPTCWPQAPASACSAPTSAPC
jgi:inner membrane protein